MDAIIISGMPASGKTTLARFLADRFGLKYFGGGDALKQIAAERGFEAGGHDWWDTEAGLSFLKLRSGNHEFDRMVDKRLVNAAKGGDVVISSYTLPWIYNGGLRIWLGASQKVRAERMAVRDDISVEESLRTVKIRDQENESLYKQLYEIDFGKDLSVFDCILSTDKLSKLAVFEIAATLVRHYR